MLSYREGERGRVSIRKLWEKGLKLSEHDYKGLTFLKYITYNIFKMQIRISYRRLLTQVLTNAFKNVKIYYQCKKMAAEPREKVISISIYIYLTGHFVCCYEYYIIFIDFIEEEFHYQNI